MPPPYTSYAALAAEQVEGVDYLREHRTPASWSWLATAVHGGAIEPGTSEMASYVAGSRMAYYGFLGIKATANSDLHITSTLIDYPDLLPLLPSARRFLSFHGYTGTAGLAQVSIGGLDGQLIAAVTSALTGAGFSVINAAQEIGGDDPTNICSRGLTRAGCQIELSNALRASFFPGGDLSRTMRDSGQRTAAFYAFGDALKSLRFLVPTYDAPGSQVALAGPTVGVYDTFTRTASSTWGTSTSGHVYTTIGGSAADYSTTGTLGKIAASSTNVSRSATVPTSSADFDVTASVATDVLAAGGSHFVSLMGRATDPDNTYLARVEFTTAQVVNVTIRKRVAGVETLLGSTVNSGLTHAANTRFAVRFRGSGTTLQAKVWLASGSEPGSWTDTVTDSSITTGYRVGVRTILSSANTNALPVNYTVDDLRTLGATLLQRSTDGTLWVTVSGAGALPGPPATVAVDVLAIVPDTPNYFRAQQLDGTSGAVLMEGDQESVTPAVNSGALTLTAVVQSVFPPRVLVSLTGLTADNITRATLYRQVGSVRTPVRAATAVDVTDEDALVRIDGEQPFGVPITYIADVTDAIGAQAELTTAPLTVTTTASAVISDAVTGIGAACVIEAPWEKSRDRNATSFNVGGRMVVVSRRRSGASATVTVRTETDADGDALDQVLDLATEGVVLIRKQVSLPRLDGHYAVLSDIERPHWYDELRWWELSTVEAEPWSDVMEARGFTLQDIADNFTTLADLAAAFPGTLLDIATYDFGP